MAQRVGGIITLRINGIAYKAKGKFTYNLGMPKREEVEGADSIHGYKEKPQAPKIEGEITDDGIDLQRLVTAVGATVTLELANGKTFVLQEAWFSEDGDAETEEGAVKVKFVGSTGEEF